MELNSFLKELGIKAKKENKKYCYKESSITSDKNIEGFELIKDSEETWINILKNMSR